MCCPPKTRNALPVVPFGPKLNASHPFLLISLFLYPTHLKKCYTPNQFFLTENQGFWASSFHRVQSKGTSQLFIISKGKQTNENIPLPPTVALPCG